MTSTERVQSPVEGVEEQVDRARSAMKSIQRILTGNVCF